MSRITVRLMVLACGALVISMYSMTATWGTPTRSLWTQGVSPALVLFMAGWTTLGWIAGSVRRPAHALAGVCVLYVGAVVGSLLSHAVLVPGLPTCRAVVSAVSLGFSDPGEMTSIGRSDPTWLRVAGLALLGVCVAAGLLPSWMRTHLSAD